MSDIQMLMICSTIVASLFIYKNLIEFAGIVLFISFMIGLCL